MILGAGAVGGTIGVRLAQAGHDVSLVARGAHAAAIRARGLRLVSPDDDLTLGLPVVEHPRELAFTGDEIVVLAVKAQDTVAALESLGAAPPAVVIVCAQNGVANEREALRRFANVVGMWVMMPAAHLEPGVVEVSSSPIGGLLDVGSFPAGVDARVEAIAGALSGATFESVARPDIMRWKYKKLIGNLANAVEAACGPLRDNAAGQELARAARDEGARVLVSAGIAVASDEEEAARRGQRLTARPIAGRQRGGGSSWQSLARATGAIEADYLNGEIVLLGRLHGIATPINAMLQRVANELARDRRPPASLTVADLRARLE